MIPDIEKFLPVAIFKYESQYQIGLYLEDLLSFFVKDHFICGVHAVFALTNLPEARDK
jgi:hypothetical protein